MTMKKGPSGVPAPERPTERNSPSENIEPRYDSNTVYQTGQGPVSRYLKHGRASAISPQDLVVLTGCGTVRKLQMLIKTERENGTLILSSSSGGYFLPRGGEEGRAEIIQFVSTIRKRALNTLRTMHRARHALEVLEGQLMLPHDGEPSGSWSDYEEDKAIPAALGLSPQQYEQEVKSIAENRRL